MSNKHAALDEMLEQLVDLGVIEFRPEPLDAIVERRLKTIWTSRACPNCDADALHALDDSDRIWCGRCDWKATYTRGTPFYDSELAVVNRGNSGYRGKRSSRFYVDRRRIAISLYAKLLLITMGRVPSRLRPLRRYPPQHQPDCAAARPHLQDRLSDLKREHIDVTDRFGFKRRPYGKQQSSDAAEFRVVGVRDEDTDDYHLYVTNPPDEFMPEQVAALYSLRWKVELLFRELKSRYGLEKFETGNKAIAELLVVALLTLLVNRALLAVF